MLDAVTVESRANCLFFCRPLAVQVCNNNFIDSMVGPFDHSRVTGLEGLYEHYSTTSFGLSLSTASENMPRNVNRRTADLYSSLRSSVPFRKTALLLYT